MRCSLLALILVAATSAMAGAQAGDPLRESAKVAKDKPLPARKLTGASSNPCAAYGAGFVRPEGTTTCVKIGGATSVGVGVR